jgi:DNA-binding beta-propeller fold protein YncE
MKPMRPVRSSLLLGLALLVPSIPLASAQVVIENLSTGAVDDAEITPDGRRIVVRENTGGGNMSVRILDALSGVVLVNQPGSAQPFNFNGAAHDAVGVTNERAVVIGQGALVFDLTPPIPVLIADHPAGFFPRDVAITPDGRFAVVRAGAGMNQGLMILDLASGAIAAAAPGEPAAIPAINFDVDSAVATDRHGVLLSMVNAGSSERARVTVFDLQPVGGGAPVVVFETSLTGTPVDQLGAPHDVTLTATGAYAAVRSELSVALYRLDGTATSQVWHKRLFGDPGPFGGSALDSIEATADRIATISRRQGPPFGAQLDVFDLAGKQWHAVLEGDPHDLGFTPGGQQLVVRTSAGVYLFDLAQLPAGNLVTPTDFEAISSSSTSFGAGLDSVAVTATRAVTLHRKNLSSEVRLWDLSGGQLGPAGTFTLPNKPCDVDLSPDGRWAAVTGTDHVQVYDLVTARLVLNHEPAVVDIGQYPWCDGVVLDGERAVAFGYVENPLFGGWISVVDLDPAAYRYCPSTPNSSGARGDLEPTGSTSIALNAAGFLASDLPKSTVGALVFGSQSAWLPFGDGTLCVSGERYTPGAFHTAGTGSALQKLDFTGAPSQGGVITAGSTWYFQVWYRDTQSAGSGLNTTNAVKLSFQP